jgi:hypothetical protein
MHRTPGSAATAARPTQTLRRAGGGGGGGALSFGSGRRPSFYVPMKTVEEERNADDGFVQQQESLAQFLNFIIVRYFVYIRHSSLFLAGWVGARCAGWQVQKKTIHFFFIIIIIYYYYSLLLLLFYFIFFY